MTGYTLDQYGGLKNTVQIKLHPRTKEPIIPSGVMVSPELPDIMTLEEGYNFVLGRDGWTTEEDHIGEMYWPAGAKWGDQPKRMVGYGPLPEGSSTTPPEEPTELDRFLESIAGKDADELRSYLYSSQRYRFVDDEIGKGPSEIAMCSIDGQPKTVDEASEHWIRYVGDDETKANAALAQKIEAKTYIRMVVAKYFEEV